MATCSAGWSSQAARRAHNPEVTGSNPVPATTKTSRFSRGFCIEKPPLWEMVFLVAGARIELAT